MLALVGTVMSRSPSGNVLLRDGDGVLGTHRLFVSRNTASSEISSIYRKLGASSRSDAVQRAMAVGLLGG
jgi:hypothetical protein